MSIEVQQNEFDLQGNLKSNGKYEFWKEVNRGMRKFNNNDITLNPCKFQAGQVIPPAPSVQLEHKKSGSVLVSSMLADYNDHRNHPKAHKCLNYSPDSRKLPTPHKVRKISPKHERHRSRSRSRSQPRHHTEDYRYYHHCGGKHHHCHR